MRRARRFWNSVGFGAVFLALASPSASADPWDTSSVSSACPSAGGERGSIANIDERLEITLKDGRTRRLAGLEPPRPTPNPPDFDATTRDALRAEAGGEIAFVPLAEKPDRWGRIAAFVFFEKPGAAPASAGQFLLAGGFARFMPELAAHPCRTFFLAAETAA